MHMSINVVPLMEAAFEAKTTEEMQICRVLANSIADRSPYAWKMFYGGSPLDKLSKKTVDALKTCMKNAEEWERRHFARKKLKFEKLEVGESSKRKEVGVAAAMKGLGSRKAKKEVVKPPPKRRRPFRARSCKRGAKLADPEPEEEEDVKAEPNKPLPPMICALPVKDVKKTTPQKEVVVATGLPSKDEGKGKVGEPCESPKIKVDDDFYDAELGKCYPLYLEDDYGNFKKYRCAEDFDSGLEDGPDIPMSPLLDGEEMDPEKHCFLLLRNGTPGSS